MSQWIIFTERFINLLIQLIVFSVALGAMSTSHINRFNLKMAISKQAALSFTEFILENQNQMTFAKVKEFYHIGGVRWNDCFPDFLGLVAYLFHTQLNCLQGNQLNNQETSVLAIHREVTAECLLKTLQKGLKVQSHMICPAIGLDKTLSTWLILKEIQFGLVYLECGKVKSEFVKNWGDGCCTWRSFFFLKPFFVYIKPL